MNYGMGASLYMFVNVLSTENQKGINSVQNCSVENQKGDIAIDFVQR